MCGAETKCGVAPLGSDYTFEQYEVRGRGRGRGRGRVRFRYPYPNPNPNPTPDQARVLKQIAARLQVEEARTRQRAEVRRKRCVSVGRRLQGGDQDRSG